MIKVVINGNPARLNGWMCECGAKLKFTKKIAKKTEGKCQECGKKYIKKGSGSSASVRYSGYF